MGEQGLSSQVRRGAGRVETTMPRPFLYDLFGQKLTRAELAELADIDPSCMHNRLRRMSVMEAVVTPLSPSAGVQMIGRRFGRLVVESEADDRTAANKRRFLCRCDCNGTTVVVGADLRSGRTVSCGCVFREKASARQNRRAENITGRTYGNGWVEVLGPGNLTRKTGKGVTGTIRSWRCKCRCGALFETKAAALRAGQTTSCGCRKRALAGVRARAKAHRYPLFGQRLTLIELATLCGREPTTLRDRIRRMTIEDACFGSIRRCSLKGRKRVLKERPRCRICKEFGHNARGHHRTITAPP